MPKLIDIQLEMQKARDMAVVLKSQMDYVKKVSDVDMFVEIVQYL